MQKNCPENERIKRDYFAYLKEAKQHSEPTVDAAAKALRRFEEYTRHRNFKAFHYQQAVSFKAHLASQKAQRTGEKLSKATLHQTMTQLKRFFQWLAWRPGYKSCFKYSDADYFNLSEKDTRIATARREQQTPTIEQIEHVLRTMPATTEIERRNRDLIAFTLLTGARDSAIASMKLKHVDMVAGRVHQDGRDVKTKFSKTFNTYFFQAGDSVLQILRDWVGFLKSEKLWGNDDPLFPATRVAPGVDCQFVAIGLERAHWSSASPIRTIFKDAFQGAGLPYFHPHSFRRTLGNIGLNRCKSAEEFKAWSQNFGHENVLTTLQNYGSVSSNRQTEIMRRLTPERETKTSSEEAIVQAVLREIRKA
uniref:Site-specific recombinase XerD-like protein n=1 Tax=mine drainage metagenome TaxID=410659 RepID=E6QLL9_9ZZZZ